MRINDNNFWLGDETSLQHNIEQEVKIMDTSAVDLQEMSIRGQTEHMETESEFGEFDYMVSRAGNLAIISISGSLTASNRSYNRYIGMISYDEIRNAVFSAMEADGIDGIVMNMDTPGGQASGVSELSDFLTEVDQGHLPIYTYAGTTMASGGYWLGSVGREIYASKLATVGSIGVITVHASYKEMYKKAGIDITVLRSGEFKALGSPYEKLDDKARTQIESQMNAIYDVFLETVAENRETSVQALKETAAEGRVFMGQDSVAVGLVDHITSFDAAIDAISKKVKVSGSRSSTPLNPSVTLTGEIDMKKKVLTEAGKAALESGVPESDLLNDPKMFEVVDEETTNSEVTESSEEESTEEESTETEEEETTSEEEEEETQVSLGNQAGIVQLATQLAEASAEVATLKVNLRTAEAERDEAVSAEAGLVKIAIAAVNRMQIAMGAAPTKLEGMSASAVIDQYNRSYTQFNQRYKVGSTAQVPEETDTGNGQANGENSSMMAAAARMTTDKVK